MSDRRYDQNELAAILRGAAEAQAQEYSGGQEPDGLTLGEIERVASEVGIDPKFIAGAAERLDVRPAAKRFAMIGFPTREIIERHVEGGLDDAAWEEVVAELRATFGSVGTTSQMGTSREWMGYTETRAIHFSATPKNGGMRYRVTVNQLGGVSLAWCGLAIGGLLTAILTGIAAEKTGLATIPIICFIVGMIAAILLIINLILSRWHAKNLKTVDGAMDRIKALTPREAVQSPMGSMREIESTAAPLTNPRA